MIDSFKGILKNKLDLTSNYITVQPKLYKTKGFVDVRSKSKFYQS